MTSERDIQWGALQSDMVYIKSALGVIDDKLTATNGRLRSLERWRIVTLTALASLLILKGDAIGSDVAAWLKLLASIAGCP